MIIFIGGGYILWSDFGLIILRLGYDIKVKCSFWFKYEFLMFFNKSFYGLKNESEMGRYFDFYLLYCVLIFLVRIFLYVF